MFTGIVEASGTIVKLSPSKSNLEIYVHSPISSELSIDQSIAHNGVCLTIDQLGPGWHRCTLIRETLDKTHFEGLKEGDSINLERAIRYNSLVDGHFVQGHADTTLSCMTRTDLNGSWTFEFDLPASFKSLVIPKGSIAINGVSLTISLLKSESFEVSIIPFTYEHTNFRDLKPGLRVNVEFDVLGKYIRRHFELYPNQGLR